jgi:DNA-binding LytR/AlgR family response regulator
MTRSKAEESHPGEAQVRPPVARVLIVDDHPAIREALAIRISTQPDLEVCGEAADVGEAARAVGALDPDVAIIDIALKGGNGIDLIKRLAARGERPRAIVWSMYSEDLYAERALRDSPFTPLHKLPSSGKQQAQRPCRPSWSSCPEASAAKTSSSTVSSCPGR